MNPVSPAFHAFDLYHGTRVSDPYRWLERLNSVKTRRWLEAQRTLTNSLLKQLPTRSTFEERFQHLWRFPKRSAFLKAGTRYGFWGLDLTPAQEPQQQPVLYLQETLGSEPAALLDPNALSQDGALAVITHAFSPDGSLLAYALSEAGSDWQAIRVRHVESRLDEADVVQWCKFPAIAWKPDNSGFFYNRYPVPRENVSSGPHAGSAIYFHRVGTAQDDDALVYAGCDDLNCTPLISEDGVYLLVHLWRSADPVDRIVYRPLASNDAFLPLIEQGEAHYRLLDNVGNTFYIETDLAAPHRRIIALDCAAPASERWRTVVPEQDDPMAFSLMAGNHLLVGFLRDASHRLALYTLDGCFVRSLAIPDHGSVTGIWSRRTETEVFLAWESFLCPATIYRYDVASEQLTQLFNSDLDFDYSAYETSSVFYPAQDGTRIPLFLTHKKGLALDGQNPTLLYGYGGFGMSVTPSFWLSQLPWLEQGGVFAVAAIRGGGEYGEAWHRAAVRERKQTSIDDFLAAATWLIEQRYTRPQRLGIMGASNGGLLVAACLTQRPELFGAVVCQNPLTDMLRYHRFTIGSQMVEEYGNAEACAEDFQALAAYSPLQQVKKGIAYPATLITTAENDLRTVPAHAMKFAAALQQATRGDAPILLRIAASGGHGVGSPASQRIALWSDILAFLSHALGDTSLRIG